MTDAQLKGHWKGVVVFAHLHSVVHLYFEQNDDALTGAFEVQDVQSKVSKGEITGSIDASNKVSLSVAAPAALEFYGELTGRHSQQEMLSGFVRAGELTVGTLTLFPSGAQDDLGILRY